jgi:hypothetical protein
MLQNKGELNGLKYRILLGAHVQSTNSIQETPMNDFSSEDKAINSSSQAPLLPQLFRLPLRMQHARLSQPHRRLH